MKKIFFVLSFLLVYSYSNAEIHIVKKGGIFVNDPSNEDPNIASKTYYEVWRDNKYMYCYGQGSSKCQTWKIAPVGVDPVELSLAETAEKEIAKGNLTGKIIQGGFLCTWTSDSNQDNVEIHVVNY